MPLRACTGFEVGYDNAGGSWEKGNAGNRLFDVRLGAPNHTTSTPRSGDRCLEINQSAVVEYIGWNADTFGASQTQVVFNFWFRFPTLPTADVDVANIWTLGGDINLWLRNSDGALVLRDETGGTDAAGPTLAASTWYHAELSVDLSAAGTTDWAVDGIAQTQHTSTPASTTLVACFLGGENSQTMHCLYDDVLIWTDTAAISGYPFGEHKMVLLKPDTGVSTTEIGTVNATGRMVTNSTVNTTHVSADILAAISEVPPLIGATATGVGQRTAGVGNAVGIPMTTYALQAGESVTGVRFVVCGWAASTTTNNIGLRVFNGNFEDILFAAADPNFDSNTTQPGWLCKMDLNNRFATQGNIDAMVIRYGYSTDVSPAPGAHGIYAELAISEASGATAVGQELAFTYNAKAPAGDDLAFTSHTRTFVSDEQTFTYNVIIAVNDILSFTHHTRAAAGDAQTFTYHTRATASDELEFRYHVFVGVPVGDDLTFSYHTRVAASDTIALTYNTKAFADDEISVTYNTRAAASDELSVIYNAKALAFDTIAFNYHVGLLSSDTLQFSYLTRAITGDELPFSYNTLATGPPPVTKDLIVTYNVIAAVPDSLSLLYNVQASVSDTLSLLYNVRVPASDELAITYNVRVSASDLLTFTYNVLQTTSDEFAFTFNIRIPAFDELQFTYNVESLVPDALPGPGPGTADLVLGGEALISNAVGDATISVGPSTATLGSTGGEAEIV